MNYPRALVFIFLAIPFCVMANVDDEQHSLFSLPVEELLQLEVTVAARKNESWLSSSGTVYVIGKSEIENYGWRDLKEILASIPNMDYFYQWSWLPGGQRGFTGNMSGTLMLIDGREVQNLLANEAFIMNNFPASRIERVEVLQGPNSTLYGGNATQGVINVITRLGQGERELHLIAGEVGTKHAHLLVNHQYNTLSMALSASYFESDQDYDELRSFVMDPNDFSRNSKDALRDLNPNNFRNDEQSYTLDGKLDYRGFYVGMNISRSKNVSGIEAVAYDYITGDDSRRGYENYYLGKQIEFSDALRGSVEVSYFREYKEKDRLTTIVPDDAQTYQALIQYNEREDIGPSDRVRVNTQWQYQVDEQTDWVFGYDGWRTQIGRKVKYRDIAGQVVLFTPPEWAKDKEKSEKHALFAQYSKTVNWGSKSLKASAGLRYNQQDFTNSAYLPRASIVFQPNASESFKITYGEAFRPPTIFEFDLVVDDELESQTMKMSELNWSKSFSWNDIKLANIAAVYSMKAENFYEKILDPIAGTWQTRVTGEHTIMGFENQLKFQAQHWQGQISYRFVKPDEAQIGDIKEVLDIPVHKLKLGLVYRLSDTWRVAGFVDHWSKVYTQANNLLGDGTEVEQIPHWTTMNLHVFRQTKRYSFGVYIENLFDRSYYHSNARGTSPVRYLQAPRNLRLQISYKF
ncbi:TonB-dependent receptor plug domain-containing protein [Pseudoalteromonas sp. T1lg23B]|uniref:TonB-dependent receptor plug domain-containing protein n=1 Tax=Pseudoalteromonas sp. T1lg23B TaxID=2077097 RepID=UPI000CF5DC14|nr:TonB-dependent receptor [Pseudoalteromonas sp. T1lg23B]